MATSYWRPAIMATAHCLLGCGIGEVLGMVISTATNLSNLWSVILSIILSFIFGYSLSLLPLVRSGMAFPKALRTALAGDTVSITSMEIIDNTLEVIIPGALTAQLTTWLFWWSLGLSLAIAFMVTVPVNYWLIKRGLGHAHH